jgi:hypothetical protein
VTPDPRPSPPPQGPEERYAEGQREEAECRHCGQPIWIIYHGPQANHTTEPRTPADEIRAQANALYEAYEFGEFPRMVADSLMNIADAMAPVPSERER